MTIGFIKLHRQFLKWEWYDDINVKVLFLHCLFRANWENQKWHGELIPRGSFITSLQNLAKETHLSIQQTRTALKKLSATNEITYEQHGSSSMITVINYNRFQNSNMEVTRSQIEIEQKNKNFNSGITYEQHGSNSMITVNNHNDFCDSNKQITNFQQTNNKRLTTIEEVKQLLLHVVMKIFKKSTASTTMYASPLNNITGCWQNVQAKNYLMSSSIAFRLKLKRGKNSLTKQIFRMLIMSVLRNTLSGVGNTLHVPQQGITVEFNNKLMNRQKCEKSPQNGRKEVMNECTRIFKRNAFLLPV